MWLNAGFFDESTDFQHGMTKQVFEWEWELLISQISSGKL